MIYDDDDCTFDYHDGHVLEHLGKDIFRQFLAVCCTVCSGKAMCYRCEHNDVLAQSSSVRSPRAQRVLHKLFKF